MRSILLVDDSRVVREVLKVYLISRDVELVEAGDGVEALAQLQRGRPPDIVIADLRMPRLDGVGLCRALKSQRRTRGLPVIILSSNLTPQGEEACRDAGAAEVLAKPVEPKRLLDTIDHLLAQPAAGARAP